MDVSGRSCKPLEIFHGIQEMKVVPFKHKTKQSERHSILIYSEHSDVLAAVLLWMCMMERLLMGQSGCL